MEVTGRTVLDMKYGPKTHVMGTAICIMGREVVVPNGGARKKYFGQESKSQQMK